ncbi:MAG: hypothetical protein LH618_07150 [Saprospiraceae bacterium]|nr:hypothetical protein [Saprospiraceae bacterium]
MVKKAKHHLMAHAEVYLKAKEFDEKEFWQWMQAYFVLRGFEWAELEEATRMDFPENNAMLPMFSVENVEMMEGELGKD